MRCGRLQTERFGKVPRDSSEGVEIKMEQRVAVLGLGTMGGGMAANLLKAGYHVSVYNRSSEKAEAVRNAGGHFGSTPAEAVKGAEFVISMLADDAACRSVWTGEHGAVSAARPGT